MRSEYEREIVLDLAKCGVNQSMIARVTWIPRSTVREWLKPETLRTPRRLPPQVSLAALPGPEYSYLLGFYLGDGALSKHRRGVYKLRIVMDAQYPRIID